MVLEEQPEKVAEAICYFLQGLGYTLKILRSRSATVRPSKLELKGIRRNGNPPDIDIKFENCKIFLGYETPLVKLRVSKTSKGGDIYV